MQSQPSTSMEVAVDPHTAQMNQFMSYIKTLGNPDCKEVLKLKAIQDISKNFEVIIIILMSLSGFSQYTTKMCSFLFR